MSMTYAAVHMRLRRNYGKAYWYACIDCACPACDWSQVHGTDSFVPRCRSCHLLYDRPSFVPPNRIFNEAEMVTIRTALRTGLTIRETANALDVGYRLIWNISKKGLTVGPQQARPSLIRRT